MAWLSKRRPDWSHGDLLPVVVTDASRGDLLMLAWANRRGALLVALARRAVAEGRNERQRHAGRGHDG